MNCVPDERPKMPIPLIQRLYENPVQFSGVLDKIPAGIVMLTKDRRVRLLNRSLEILTGFTQGEAFNIPCSHVLRSNICLKDCPSLRMGAESGPVCVEGNIINKDRQLIPVRITSAPVNDRQGRLVGMMETIEDLRPFQKDDMDTGHAYSFNHIVGRSPEMEKIFTLLPSLAQSDSSVLITGETGTGKDMVAETIHQMSERAKGPFVKINCGALPETLLESELFGHRKGAFTGAVENKPGRFNMAHNGTLYLTEIGDLPLPLQVKLLTFLDDKVVFPLGSTKGFIANVRVIAATHHHLEQMVQKDRFRKDLLFRLNVVRLHLPALRDRQGDIRLLLDHFLHALSSQMDRKTPGFSAAAMDILQAYTYPGNVRELRNIVEYAMNVCKAGNMHSKHLPSYLTDADPYAFGTAPSTSFDPFSMAKTADSAAPQASETDWNGMERQLIMNSLVRSGGRRGKAAKDLGWARSTLWRKMKRYGIG